MDPLERLRWSALVCSRYSDKPDQEPRRQRRRKSGTTHAWAVIVRLDPCCYAPWTRCGCRTSASVEHVQPRASGGPRGWDNVVGACLPCNNRRGDTPLLLFLVQMRQREEAERRRRERLERRRQREAEHRARRPLGLFADKLRAALGPA